MTSNTTILLSWLVSFLTAFLVTWRLSLRCIVWGRRFNIMSEVEERSSHTVPTPRIGGVAIFAGFFCALGAGFLAFGFLIGGGDFPPGFFHEARAIRRDFFAVLASAILFFALGFLDDLRNLPALAKLAGQILALTPVMFFAPELEFPRWGDAPVSAGTMPVGAPAAFAWRIGAWVWILFFVNAYNFMDGMDGLAAFFAIHVCFWILPPLILLWALGQGIPIETLPVAAIFGVALGFLLVNLPPARIFMGDGGSHFLGFLLAVAGVQAATGQYVRFIDLAIATLERTYLPVMILFFPFVFDVVVTLLRRLSRRENPLTAHGEHLYQRLLGTGLTHREVLSTEIGLLTFIGIACFASWFILLMDDGMCAFPATIPPPPPLASRLPVLTWTLAHALMSIHLVNVHLSESKIKRT